MWCRLAAWSVGCLLCLIAHGQQYGFSVFTPRDGLAQSQVRCITEDTLGHLWFGTLGGASRFDGSDFRNFALQEGLPDVQVSALLTAADGDVWLACGTKAVRFDGSRMHVEGPPSELSGHRMVALAQDAAGRLLAGTDGAGVLRRGATGWERLPGYPEEGAANVRTLYVTPRGDLLVGLRNGLLRWSNGTTTKVEAVGDASVSAVEKDREGGLWIGTFSDGLLHLAPDGRTMVYDEENGLLQPNIRDLLLDDRGRLWISTKSGVNILENGVIQSLTSKRGMPNDNIWSLHQDRSGRIWMGTDGGGLLRYAGERFVSYTTADGLCNDLVMCAGADTAGRIWLGTYGSGICRLDGSAMYNVTHGVPNNTVWCTTALPDGRMVFGTSNGLCLLNERGPVHLDSARGLTGERVLSMLLDRNGKLWCGTRDKVAIVDLQGNGPTTTLSKLGGHGLRSVRGMARRNPDELWLATDNGLLHHTDTATRTWTAPDRLSDNTVFCVLADPKGRIWAGTSNGLNCITEERTVVIRFGSDFGSNYIGFLLLDAQGTIWAGTNNGIEHFHPDSLLSNPALTEPISTEDGLRGTECNLNAAFRDATGKLYFGTNGGLVLHDPGVHWPTSPIAPPTARITDLRSFFFPTDWAGSADSLDRRTGLPVNLNLPYLKNHLTFDFTAVMLVNADQLRFQFRLIGFDPDWSPPTEARFATYSNLPHGEYTFEVRAGAKAGQWGPVERFSFRIHPPFWLRWWFHLGVFLILFAAVATLVRWRHLRRQRSEKTRQLMLRSRMLQLEQQALNANMNRHFIFNALNSIQYYINRQDRTAANRYLTSFAKLIRKNLDASTTDTVSLREELARLELYLTLEHMRFRDKFDYSIQVAPGVDSDAIEIPAMMLQPYVENSIWHGILPTGRMGNVRISVLALGPERVRVAVEDDGVGIERSLSNKAEQGSDHISQGIEITKGRADVLRNLELTDIRIDGPRQITGADGEPKGTLVTIDLPRHGGSIAGKEDLPNRGL